MKHFFLLKYIYFFCGPSTFVRINYLSHFFTERSVKFSLVIEFDFDSFQKKRLFACNGDRINCLQLNRVWTELNSLLVSMTLCMCVYEWCKFGTNQFVVLNAQQMYWLSTKRKVKFQIYCWTIDVRGGSRPSSRRGRQSLAGGAFQIY